MIRITSLRLMYIVIYSTVDVMIENIKIKVIFNNGAEVNCMFKRLIDVAQLFIHQSINIIMINIIDKRTRFP